MPAQEQDRHLTLELATTALFCEIVRADYQHDPREMRLLRKMLQQRFSLDEAAVDKLMQSAEEESE